MSIYDNSSGEAVNIKTVEIAGSCYAEVFNNPKALLFDENKNMFAFSYQNWNYTASTLEQGLAVFNFDTNAVNNDDKLTYLGTLSNQGQINPYNTMEGYYYYYWSFVERGIRIGEYLYTTSDRFDDLANLEVVETLDLYE